MNEQQEPQILTGLYTFVSGYVDVHKEGTGHLSLGEEASFHPASRTSYWGSTIGIFECLDARVLFIFLRS